MNSCQALSDVASVHGEQMNSKGSSPKLASKSATSGEPAPLAIADSATVKPAGVDSPLLRPRRFSCSAMSLPLSPDHLHFSVTTPSAAVANTGRLAALTAAASDWATSAKVAPLATTARTRTPPIYRFRRPDSVAAPVTVTVPSADVPVPLTGKHQTSPAGSMRRHVSYICASIEPGPPMPTARPRLDTRVSLPTSAAVESSLTCATINRGMVDVALLA